MHDVRDGLSLRVQLRGLLSQVQRPREAARLWRPYRELRAIAAKQASVTPGRSPTDPQASHVCGRLPDLSQQNPVAVMNDWIELMEMFLLNCILH